MQGRAARRGLTYSRCWSRSTRVRFPELQWRLRKAMLEGRTRMTARAQDGSSKWDMKKVSIEESDPNKYM
jgi:hypothetical protein